MYATVTIVGCVTVVAVDADSPIQSSLDLSSASAGAALAALGGGMITFTGFVMSVVLLIVQGPNDVVPYRALVGALVLTAASVVAHVTQRIDVQARRVFDAVYPASNAQVEAGRNAATAVAGRSVVQELGHSGVGAILVAINRGVLVRLAERHDALIEVCPAVGDHVASDGLLVRVYATSALPVRPVSGALTFGDEPTIEDVLRYAAAKHLSAGVVTDRDGAVRVLFPTPTWDDLVDLALDEVRAFGAGHYQIARRLRALLTDLIADLPEERLPPLTAQLALLEDAIERSFPPAQRAHAQVADRQGLGMTIQTDDQNRRGS